MKLLEEIIEETFRTLVSGQRISWICPQELKQQKQK